jgi:hypothetical protein
MLKLRKIPLGALIEILQDLWDGGADYIDLSGEQNDDGDTPKDMIHITIKPEYILHEEGDDDVIEENVTQEIEIDYSEDDIPDVTRKTLSEDDINDLI